MICVTCGKENPEDSKFCCNCGNPLVDDKQNGNCEEQESAGNYREQLICGNNSESVNVGNSSELRCPHCNSTNLVRNQRQGCLGWIGEVLGFGLLIGIIHAIGWNGLANFLYEASPFLILLSFIYMIYQKMKPDWTWDMECKDCGHTFEYDSSLKRIKTK